MKNSKSLLNELNLDDAVFINSNGNVIKLTDVSSIRSVKVLDPSNLDAMFIVDFVDSSGTYHAGYSCTFDTLHLAVIMLFSESEKEDFTTISVNFVGLASMMIMSWFKGSDEARLGRLSADNEMESESKQEKQLKVNKNILN